MVRRMSRQATFLKGDGTDTLPAKEEERQSVKVDVRVEGTFIAEEAALELPDLLLEEFGAPFFRKAANI